MQTLYALLALLLTLPCLAEDTWREDFSDMSVWRPQPGWVGRPSIDYSVEYKDGIATFLIPEAGLGMKWARSLGDQIDFELSPWLVFSYRLTNCDTVTPDYLLWVKDRSSGDGVRVLKGDAVIADGQWHTVAFNLTEEGAISPLSQVAVQCWANASGNATLQIKSLAITDIPPADAENISLPQGPVQEWNVGPGTAEDWDVRPDWLNFYTENSRVIPASIGVRFEVDEGAMGAKWSRKLSEPVVNASYVAMRYRSKNVVSDSNYALYVANGDSGSTPEEQYAIKLYQLINDGEWHVASAPVTVSSINTLATFIPAAKDNAYIEISEIIFTDRKIPSPLASIFNGVTGWEEDISNWKPVSMPAGNLSGEAFATRTGYTGWLPEGHVTVNEIPFIIRGGTDALMMTPVRQPGEIVVPLGGRAAEAYFLLAAQFPSSDEPSYSGSNGIVRHVHRLVARIEYADGYVEEQFPFKLNPGTHAILQGISTYSLALAPYRDLKQITFTDNMQHGAFGLVAMTLSQKPGPATSATTIKASSPVPSERPIAARPASIIHDDDLIHAESWTLGLTLDCTKGLRVVSARNYAGEGITAHIGAGPLFRLEGDGIKLTSDDFKVTAVSREEDGRLRVSLLHDATTPTISITVWIDVLDPNEVGLQAAINLNGRAPDKLSFVFPEVRDIRFSEDPQATWVFCPRRGDVITRETLYLREPYAGAGNPLQIIGAFDPVQGTGLYLMTQDFDGLARFYQVQKNASGGRLAVEYTPLMGENADPVFDAHSARPAGLQPGEVLFARTLLGCNQGDWHQQLERYQQWLSSWYQPAAPYKNWFREVFNFRQHFLHFALPEPSGMFDPETKKLDLLTVVKQDIEAFGGVDYLHLFDWGWDPVHGRCGDYNPWEYLGGVEKFRDQVSAVMAEDIPVGLYIEGILVDPQSDLGKAYGEQWQMLNSEGKPYTYFAPSYHICMRIPQWQEYLSDTYARVKNETGAVGFYIDEFGFSAPTYWCYNTTHDHPTPVTPVVGERQMLRQVREKLGPDAAIYTEESPTDVNSQYQDGSFTYNISSVPDEWSPTHINLYRFAIPRFKTIEIITCDQPLGSNIEAVKRILFNGEAIWLEGIVHRWFTPEVCEQIALNHRVMRDNRDCFTGDKVRPLVPTLIEGIYANQFGHRSDLLGKTCWTIYNTHFRTVRGEVIAVDHAPGTQYMDEINGKVLEPRIEGDKAYITMELAPRDVAVISRLLVVQ